MFQRLALTCIVLFLASTSLAAGESGIYKWVDDNGEVHYSRESSAGRDVKKMKIVAPPPVVEVVDDKHVSPPAEVMDAASANENDGADAGMTKAEYDRLSKENCATARRNHVAFQEGKNKSYMSPDGKVIQLTEEVRLQRISEAEQQIEKYCHP